MLSIFIRNRRGAITVMLSFILIAVLSVNSTFLETARYRGLSSLYKEIEENALFSILAHYDRDLYSNFGLLAVDQDIDKDDYMRYVMASINNDLKDAVNADKFLGISADDVDFEKIYVLAQSDILRQQIDEFCAGRAPVYILNEVFDIENALKSLLKQLEDCIPFLDVFKELLNQAQNMVDMFIALNDYCDSSKELNAAVENYMGSVNEYNEAVSARDEYLASFEDEDESTEGEDESEKEQIDEEYLKQLNERVKSKAVELQSVIEDTKDKLADFYNKYVNFYNKYETYLNGNMAALLAAAKEDAKAIENDDAKESANKMIDTMESSYKSTKASCDKLSVFMNKGVEMEIQTSQEQLLEQYNLLAGEGSGLNSVSAVNMTNGISFMDLARLTISTAEAMLAIVEKVGEVFASVGEIFEIFQLLETGGTYEILYNNVVNAENIGGSLNNIGVDYNEDDKAMKDNKIAETNEVANAVGFDLNIFNSYENMPGNNTLQNALQRAVDELNNFMTNVRKINSGIAAISITVKLIKIGEIIACAVNLLDAFINLGQVASQALAGDDIAKIAYQKLNAAVYANSMFSNRTNVDSGTRLNGSKFAYYSQLKDDGSCFDAANVEYIIGGTVSEIINQVNVYTLILAIRVLCNLPAVLGNELVMEIVEGLSSTVILIPLAIIVFLAILIIEAFLDMIFIVYTDDGVDFIKLKGYLDVTKAEGTDITEYLKELKEAVKNIQLRQAGEELSNIYNGTELSFSDEFNKSFNDMYKNTIGKPDPNQKKDDKDKAEGQEKKINMQKWAKDYKDGLTKASYSNHTFMLLLLLVSTDKIYSRCADLINMQMKQIKKGKGKVTEFDLRKMATYLRVESTAYYTPLLPIPVIPGLNDKGIPIKTVQYSGY